MRTCPGEGALGAALRPVWWKHRQEKTKVFLVLPGSRGFGPLRRQPVPPWQGCHHPPGWEGSGAESWAAQNPRAVPQVPLPRQQAWHLVVAPSSWGHRWPGEAPVPGGQFSPLETCTVRSVWGPCVHVSQAYNIYV